MSRPSNDDLAAGRLEQPGDQPAGGALAAAGLADQRERLARRTLKSMPSTAWTARDLPLQEALA